MESATHYQKILKSAKIIGITSVIMALCLITHHFFITDTTVAKEMLNQSKVNGTDAAAHNIVNSFTMSGILFILANLTGILAFFSKHKYLWWFMLAIYFSQLFIALVNPPQLYTSIIAVKSFLALIPYVIVILLSIVMFIYVLMVAIKHKKGFQD
ncbi:hypothetical protein [Staphylococcus massiliensis]|uniref:Uncharacterized protein n=1 Tax=Staphylococcus massiliensis S46 TaxID=1229783 RepID=K9AR31_9STAP|nr:hypothetical protein [Staphylococcus massiliensis]EKU48481.1 hypothetical protein C273_04700 [Staphylococcus massiliensis S46]MCG3400396.1 hypothetical protein [Staphylococcus massiliensis]MCG3401757.1 hypothetical protein [Staphylococcus massiliensis]MCG3412629.1 hypothetical protein [Staphylococcus massiliensis]PNZ98615.1 hypothetical protein CD133_08280 [Staphylococcus massiliensis CCUG 55927]